MSLAVKYDLRKRLNGFCIYDVLFMRYSDSAAGYKYCKKYITLHHYEKTMLK